MTDKIAELKELQLGIEIAKEEVRVAINKIEELMGKMRENGEKIKKLKENENGIDLNLNRN